MIAGAIEASRLDLRPWRDRHGDRSGLAALPPLALDVNARESGGPLRSVAGRLERNAAARRRIELGARLEGGETMAFGYAGDARWPGRPARRRRRRFLQALGIEQARIAGGRLQLDADVTLAPTATTVAGELELREFALLRSPVLARIFTLASLEGLASTLSGTGIPIERLTVHLAHRTAGGRAGAAVRLGGRRARRRLGRPRRAPDRAERHHRPGLHPELILGRIPLIGPIMRGRDADAALAATFGVTGPLDAPDIVVNPLAALVPGIIRDLFRDLGAAPRARTRLARIGRSVGPARRRSPACREADAR